MRSISHNTRLASAGVVIVIVLVVCGWCIRRDGIKVGALDQKIVAAADKSKELELAVAVVTKAADVEVKKSIAKRTDYNAARAKVQLKGDTVVSDGQVVRLPSVAGALRAADSLKAQDSTAFVKEAEKDPRVDSLIAGYHKHVDLLEQTKRPRFGVKTGLAIGVVSTAAVVIIAVKIIKAVAHR